MAVKKLVGKVQYKDNLSGQIWLVRIKFDEDLFFFPGQHVSVKVSESGERRSYSVASLPSELEGGKKDYIDILIDATPMGLGSRFFLGLKVGDPVEILGFLGKFAVDETSINQNDILLFVATGTGIAPIKPIIEDLLTVKSYKGKVILVWGMRKEADLYWSEEMERLVRDYDNFSFELVLSQPEQSWPGNKGHVGDVIGRLNLEWSKVKAFLCGAPEMIEEMKDLLAEKGIYEKNVTHEKYA